MGLLARRTPRGCRCTRRRRRRREMTNQSETEEAVVPLVAAAEEEEEEESLKRACDIVDEMIIETRGLRLHLEKEGEEIKRNAD
jgi:hypothetical protein